MAAQRGTVPNRARTSQGRGSPDDLGKRQGQGGHERHRHGRVQDRVEEVLAVTTSEQWPPLGGVQTFYDEEHPEDGQGQRAHYDDTKACHRPGEVCATPLRGPPGPDEDGGYDDDRAGREVDPRRQGEPRPAGLRTLRLRWPRQARADGLVQDGHGDLSVLRSGS